MWSQRTIFIGIVCIITMLNIIIDFMLETLNPYTPIHYIRIILTFLKY